MQRGLSFLLHQEVPRIFNNFTALFQIRIGFYSPEGEEIKVGRNQEHCAYCRLVRSTAAGEAACREEDARARGAALEARRPKLYTCHAGLQEAILPLYRDETLLGFVMIGQIRTRATPPPPYSSSPEMNAAFTELPLKGANELIRIVELFGDLMNLVSERSLIRIKNDSRIGILISALEQSPARFAGIEDAAAFVHISPSRLAHLLREELDTSFTELSRHYRLNYASSRLVGSEDPVKRIALDAGFTDPRYFSRLFKREFGETPESFRRRHISPPA